MAIKLFGQSPDADKIIGLWQSKAGDSKTEIFRNRIMYSGKLLAGWGNKLYEADGKTPAKDVKNPKVVLRGNTILNSTILSGFSYHDGKYTGGSLYDPKSGRFYNCEMKLKGDKLEMRIYWKFYILGMTKEFKRFQREE